MAHAIQVRAHATRRTNRKKKESKGLAQSVIDTMVEVGQAAENLKGSWDHLKKAGKKSEQAVKPAMRTARKAARAVKRMTHTATGSARRAIKSVTKRATPKKKTLKKRRR